MGSRIGLLAILVTSALSSLLSNSAQAQLKVGYYKETCYEAEDIVRQEVASALSKTPELAGSLLRLHFHDCFVRGCDGSILLDPTDDITNVEKKANSSATLRGFEVIDNIKEKLEEACPGIVSCADILAIVARDAVNLSGGPSWHVQTGRLDGRMSHASETKDLPPPNSDFAQLKAAFAEKNLTTKDLVVLSGAHTIGFSHCNSFRDRLYTGGNHGSSNLDLNPAYMSILQSKCSANHDVTVQMAPKNSPRFDTSYYSYVATRRGLFLSDAVLLADDFTGSYVMKHATGCFDKEFFADFGEAMVNMGSIESATTQGEVRRKCSRVNNRESSLPPTAKWNHSLPTPVYGNNVPPPLSLFGSLALFLSSILSLFLLPLWIVGWLASTEELRASVEGATATAAPCSSTLASAGCPASTSVFFLEHLY